ncbi:DUF1565 domain-containing protein [Labilibacter sediminis]|nr:DUF1565 domain-containing protein [Labilibacter sediminis]
MMKRILFLILVICIGFNLRAKEYFVSPSGKDSNKGSQESPFRTINTAIKFLKAGDTCFLREGTYNEEVDISNLRGSKNNPIIISAYNNEKVIFDGSDPITGKWEKHSENIYKLKIKEPIWQLFQGDEMKILARWPNASFTDGSIWDMKSTWRHQGKASVFGTLVDERPVAADYMHNEDEGASTFEVKEGKNLESLADTKVDFTGATAVLNIGSWLSWAQPVIEHAAGSNTFKYSKNFSRPGKKPEPNGPSILRRSSFFEAKKNQGHYYMVGLMALDAPNEWFYDDAKKTVYVYIENGKQPNEISFKGKRRTFNIKGKNASFVTISGIDFFATTFQFTDAQNVTVENGDFKYPSYHKLALKDYREPEVTGFIMSNKLYREQKTESNNVIFNCKFEYADGPGFKIKGIGDRVENCYFHDIDWTCLGSGSSGTLDASNTEKFVFRSNTVHTGGNSEGVRLGHANLAEYNHIYNLSLLQHDGSGINVGTNAIDQTIVRYNWVHDMKKSGIRFDSRGFMTVNVEWGEHGTIDHNVVWKTGSIKAKGNHHTITNNIAFDSNKGMYDIGVPRVLVMGSNNSQSVIHNNIAGSIGGHFSQKKGFACPGDFQNNKEGDIGLWLKDPNNWDFRPQKNIGDIGAYKFTDQNYWIPGCKMETASVPIPFNGAVNLPSNLDLMWKEALVASEYHIYFGNDSLAVLTAHTSSNEFKGSTKATTFTPKSFNPNLKYFWRVDVVNSSDIIKGELWSLGGKTTVLSRTNKLPLVKKIKYQEVTSLPESITKGGFSDDTLAKLHKLYNSFWSGYDNNKWLSQIQKELKKEGLSEDKRKHLEVFYNTVMKESLDYIYNNSSNFLNIEEKEALAKIVSK